MRVTCRTIEPDGHLPEIEEGTALAGWREGKGAYWVALETPEPEEMIHWLTGLGLDPELLAAWRASDSTGKVLPLDQAVFFEYPVPAPDDLTATHVFACLCLDRLVITLHLQPIHPESKTDLLAKLRLRALNPSGLVCAIIVSHSQRLRRAALMLRDSSRKLADLMDDDGDAVRLEDIQALKRRLLDVDRMADEQMAVFEFLSVIDRPELNLVGLTTYFTPALSNAMAADRRLERLDRAVSDLQRRYDSLQQDKTNRRLGVLTILSAVFMPLTLIAGIYGMNFEVMPELHFRYAYPIALGGMVVVAGGLYAYFRSRGWLD